LIRFPDRLDAPARANDGLDSAGPAPAMTPGGDREPRGGRDGAGGGTASGPTEYAIRLLASGEFLDGTRPLLAPCWTDSAARAYRFAHETTALIFAADWLELDPADFSVDPL